LLSPPVGTTYARRGHRPSICINCNVTDRLYVASAISEQGKVVFHTRQEPYDTDGIITFLQGLLEQVPGKVLLVWDGASVHKSAKLRQFLCDCSQAWRLHLVIQPPYSPHLNADELLWQRLKNVALKNSCFQNFKELKNRVIEEINQLANNSALIKNFFKHPDLGFYHSST